MASSAQTALVLRVGGGMTQRATTLPTKTLAYSALVGASTHQAVTGEGKPMLSINVSKKEAITPKVLAG